MISKISSYNLAQPKAIAFGNNKKAHVHMTPQRASVEKEVNVLKQLKNLVHTARTTVIAVVTATTTTVVPILGGGCSHNIDAPAPPSKPTPGIVDPTPDTRSVSETFHQWLDSLGIQQTTQTKAATFSNGDTIAIDDAKLNQRNAYGFHPNAKDDTVYVNMTETDLDGKHPAKDYGKMYKKDGNILMDFYDQNGKFNFTRKWIKDGLNIKEFDNGNWSYKYVPGDSINKLIKTTIFDGINEAGSRIINIPYYVRK